MKKQRKEVLRVSRGNPTTAALKPTGNKDQEQQQGKTKNVFIISFLNLRYAELEQVDMLEIRSSLLLCPTRCTEHALYTWKRGRIRSNLIEVLGNRSF